LLQLTDAGVLSSERIGNLVRYRAAEFNAKARARGEVLARVLQNPVLMIVGKERDLGEPGQDRQV
jgi:hypothetical protein